MADDDDPDLRALMVLRLSRGGIDVLTACDGQEALDRARHGHPDVALLDVNMPGLSGVEVAERLRADPPTAGISIVLISATFVRGPLDPNMLGQADDYIVKPFGRDDPLTTVQALITQQQARTTGAAAPD